MKSLVVLFALTAVACGSLLPLAQPPHHPAVVLDPRGRPLDTAEVIGARALHLQAKALESHSPLAYSVIAAPAVVATPWIGHASISAHGYAGHGHWLQKRSLGHIAIHAPAAVSHQSRVDVISRPAIVSHAVAPIVTHVAPAAVSHQSRIDVHSSPIITHAAIAAPVHSSVSVWPAHGAYGYGHGHLLKKRSLSAIVAPVAHVAPVAQIAHVAHVVPAAVSHQSRVDVISKPALTLAPIAHSAVWAAPAPYWSHGGHLNAHV